MSWSSRVLAALLCLVIGLAPGLSASAQDGPKSQKRIALVVGNAAYEAGALGTPANDAGLVAQTLQAAGFDVVGARDLDEDSLRKALRDFTDKAESSGPDTVAFVYLAGYGLQLAGENYFVPVDARIPAAADVPSRALRLSDYTRQLAALPLAARFVVLDGARNNPFARNGDPLAGGLALTEAEPGSLIAFNASPGTVGPDEKGSYGAYATALVEMIREGGLAPAQVFDRVRLRVDETTRGAEVPWHSSRIDANFTFFERAPDAPPVGRPDEVASLRARPLKEIGAREAYAVCLQRDSLDGYQEFVQAYPRDDMAKRVRALIAARREAVTWRRTWTTDSRDAYWSYLDRYPRGPHAWDARRRLRQLSAALEPPPRFAAISYDVPPPPPEEIVYVQRPALYLDDPVYALAPPPPPPPVFLPPPPAYIVDLAPPPPPPPVAYYALPTPAFVPVPTYVSAPDYIVPPPNNVIYQNIHNVTVINTINERNVEISRNPGAVSPGLAAGAGAVAGAALGAAAARVALPPAVAQKAALRNPPTNPMPGAPGQAGTPGPFNNPQAGSPQGGRPGTIPGQIPGAVPGQPALGANGQPLPPQPGRPGTVQPNSAAQGQLNGQPGQPNAPLGVAGRGQPGQALPGANGQPLPPQPGRPDTAQPTPTPGAPGNGQPAPQQAGRPGTTPPGIDPKDKPNAQQAGRPLPGANGQPLPPQQAGRPGTDPRDRPDAKDKADPQQAARPGAPAANPAAPDAKGLDTKGLDAKGLDAKGLDTKGRPDPQQAGRALPGMDGQPLPPQQAGRPGTERPGTDAKDRPDTKNRPDARDRPDAQQAARPGQPPAVRPDAATGRAQPGQPLPGANGPLPPQQGGRPGSAGRPQGGNPPGADTPDRPGPQQAGRPGAPLGLVQPNPAQQRQDAAAQRQQQIQAQQAARQQQADQARQAAQQRQQMQAQQADQARQAQAAQRQQMQADQARQAAAAQRQQMQAQQAAQRQQMQAQQAQQAAQRQQMMQQQMQAQRQQQMMQQQMQAQQAAQQAARQQQMMMQRQQMPRPGPPPGGHGGGHGCPPGMPCR